MIRLYLFLLTALVLSAQQSPMERASLFTGGQGGYIVYRIPGIVVTAKGSVLVYCEARSSDRGDWNAIDIVLRRSTDGGRTFDAMRKIADVPGPHKKNPVALAQNLASPNEVTYNNPTAIVDRKSGAVHMLFNLEYMRAFHIRSDDDGMTWSRPTEITTTFDQFRPEYDWKVLATGPAHGIQLRSGRLLSPVWLSTGTGGHAHRPSVVTTIYSDDNGKTWQRGAIAVPNSNDWVNPSETTMVELADGFVMLNARSESKTHRRLISYSRDGAGGWSVPRFHSELLEPICLGSMARMSLRTAGADRNRLLFVNPHNLERGGGPGEDGKSRDRRNVTVKLSYDEGVTWPVSRVLEPEWSGYADLAALADGTVLCLFERNSQKEGRFRTESLDLARLRME